MRPTVVAVLSSFLSVAHAQPLDPAALEAYVDGAVGTAMADHRIPGVIISVVQGADLVLEKGYGFAREPGMPADPATSLFRVASISKTFNATALMQLVEQERMDLDADFTTYLPDLEFSLPHGTVRVRDLLTHSAGFEDSYFGHFWAVDDASDHALDDYVARYQPAQVRAPGERVVYSNYGTAVVGLIIERVSGMPYADYMERHVLRPIGMERSTFRDWPGEPRDGYLPAELEASLAHSYTWTGGRYKAPDWAWMHRGMAPAGGLVATAREMSHFMRAQLTDGTYEGGRILLPETLERMHRPLIGNHPAVAANAHGFWVNDAWGYTTREHGGSIFGFMSTMLLVPELDLGIFVSTNTPSGYRLSAALPYRIVGQFFERRTEVPAPGDPEVLEEFAGEYLAQRRGYTTVDKLTAFGNPTVVGHNDQGYLTVTSGSNTRRFVALGDDRFMDPDSGERIAFTRDDAGRPTMLHGGYGHNNFERAGLMQRGGTVNWAAGLLGLALVAWLLALALTRHLRRPETRDERTARYLALGAAAAWVTGVVAMTVDFSGVYGLTPPHFAHFPTAWGWVWVSAGPIAAALTVVLAVYLVSVWRRGASHLSRRITLTAFAVSGIALALLLESWNLLGLRIL